MDCVVKHVNSFKLYAKNYASASVQVQFFQHNKNELKGLRDMICFDYATMCINADKKQLQDTQFNRILTCLSILD